VPCSLVPRLTVPPMEAPASGSNTSAASGVASSACAVPAGPRAGAGSGSSGGSR
jgi:hypothetical protein